MKLIKELNEKYQDQGISINFNINSIFLDGNTIDRYTAMVFIDNEFQQTFCTNDFTELYGDLSTYISNHIERKEIFNM